MTIKIEYVQGRVAKISTSSAVLRGQEKGSGKIAKEHLKEMDLSEFSSVANEEGLLKILDEHTKSLKEKLPNKKSWGVARKVMNIFLFESAHNIRLSKKYNLEKLIPYLELTLDNKNAKKVIKIAKSKRKKLKWENIKNLKPEDSRELQEFAKEIARDYRCERCELDFYWWGD